MDNNKGGESVMDKEHYTSLENALRLLALFSIDKSELKVKEVANQLSIANSTAHRLLKTLEEEGFIVKDNITNNYRLGVLILSLSSVITENMDIVKMSTNILNEISDKFRQTAQIGVIQNNHIYYVNRVDYAHPVLGVQIFYSNWKAPIHCTSSGKVLLANKSKDKIDQIINSELTQLTEKTVTDPEMFRKQLDEIRRKEHSITIDEHIDGICSIAVPIKEKSGTVIAALEVIKPSQQINGSKTDELIKTLFDKSKDLTNILS